MGITNDDGFCVFKINKNILINDNCYKNGKLTFYVDTAFSDVENLNTHAIFTYNNIGLHLIDDHCVIFKKDDIYKTHFVNVLASKVTECFAKISDGCYEFILNIQNIYYKITILN
jgi:hypothetical protein